MISKKAFVSIMEAIETQAKLDDKHGDILTQLADPKFQYHKVVFTTPLIDSVVKALAEDFKLAKDKWIGDEISYFIWELGFGKSKNAIDCITRDNGSKLSLTTPEQLYDWLMEVRSYSQPVGVITIDDRVKEEAVQCGKVIQPIISKRGTFL